MLSGVPLHRFDLLEKHGCTAELASRLNYAYDKVETMINNKSGTGRTLATASKSNR